VAPSRLVLLGHPVAHSLSPRFQNAALRHAGIALTYEVLDVPPASLADTVGALHAAGAAGNVTIPHKEAMAALVTERSALADRVGAVNTFLVRDGLLIGDNTDVVGVERAIGALLGERGVGGATCAVLGAGGSAAATLVALERLGAGSIRMWSRTRDRAATLCRRVGVHATVHETAADACEGASLVVNATPLGMQGESGPMDPSALGPGTAALDLVYRSGETPWVLACRARGLRAHDGLRMLVEQGAAAYRLWFGVEPSREAMWGALEARP
jgi:shikimate dehydrogenase